MISDGDGDDKEITATVIMLHYIILYYIILLYNYHLPDSGLNDLYLFLHLIITTML